MPKWYTADLHLGHARIVTLTGRPFANVSDMDEAIIARWNNVVSPEDDVYVVGDFAFRSKLAPNTYLHRLKGRKHLINGNHDSKDCRASRLWSSVQDYAEINDAGRRVVLFHYGLRTWNKMRRGAIHLYGHSHGNLSGFALPDDPDRPGRIAGCIDVGVDCWNFTPITLEMALERISKAPSLPNFDAT